MEYKWPIEEHWNHRQVRTILNSSDVKENWKNISDAIKSLSWDDIYNLHNSEYADKQKSISKALNESLQLELISLGARNKVEIFAEKPFNKAPYIIEQKLDNIAIDYVFGHYNTIPWKISRLAASMMSSNLEKSIKPSVGILILVDKELKKSGNFDSGIGTWEQAVDYLRVFDNQWDAPILLLGLTDPGIFQIEDKRK